MAASGLPELVCSSSAFVAEGRDFAFLEALASWGLGVLSAAFSWAQMTSEVLNKSKRIRRHA